MARFPILRQPIVIIELEPGQLAPAGADWIELGPVAGQGWIMDTNIPIGKGFMGPTGAYRRFHLALADAVDFAMWRDVRVLWIEADARRCRAGLRKGRPQGERGGRRRFREQWRNVFLLRLQRLGPRAVPRYPFAGPQYVGGAHISGRGIPIIGIPHDPRDEQGDDQDRQRPSDFIFHPPNRSCPCRTSSGIMRDSDGNGPGRNATFSNA